MATNEVDRSRIDEMISAIRDRRTARAASVSAQVEMRNVRQSVAEELKPIFDRAGLDVEEINRVLTRHQQDFGQLVEERKSQIATKLAGRAEERRAELAYRSRVLNRIANTPHLCVTIPLQEAYLIWSWPLNMLTGSGTEPGNNWGKITYYSEEDAGVGPPGAPYFSLDFYFFWQNQTDAVVFLTATTELSALGYLYGKADPGWFGGDGIVRLYVDINAYLGDSYISGGSATMGQVDARSTGLFGVFGLETSSDYASTTFYGKPSTSVSCPETNVPIEVAPDQVVVFEVSLLALVLIYNGSAGFDFSSSDYSIVCPGINLEACFLLGPSLNI